MKNLYRPIILCLCAVISILFKTSTRTYQEKWVRLVAKWAEVSPDWGIWNGSMLREEKWITTSISWTEGQREKGADHLSLGKYSQNENDLTLEKSSYSSEIGEKYSRQSKKCKRVNHGQGGPAEDKWASIHASEKAQTSQSCIRQSYPL